MAKILVIFSCFISIMLSLVVITTINEREERWKNVNIEYYPKYNETIKYENVRIISTGENWIRFKRNQNNEHITIKGDYIIKYKN